MFELSRRSSICLALQKRLSWSVMACCLIISMPVAMGSEVNTQIDDMQNDLHQSKGASKKLLGKDARLVPIPIPISNPTIGSGLAVALIYMHTQKNTSPGAPITATGVAGMYTDTESWSVGALHDGYYRDDWIRFKFPIGYGDFNLKFYGTGNDSPLKDNPLEYNAAASTMTPRLLFRLPWDHWFLGGSYRLVDIETEFEFSDVPVQLPAFEQQTKTSGFGLVSVYDSRNSNFWPTSGSWLDLSATKYGAYAGGEHEYFKLITKWAQYFSIIDTVSWVYRLDGQFIDGEAPFWDLSQVRLRGYAGGQLLDNVAVTAQTEIRWDVYNRWTILAFAGGGRISESVGDLGSAPTQWSGGGGVKYLLVKETNLKIGIDLAWAEGGDLAVYFQVGDWLTQ